MTDGSIGNIHWKWHAIDDDDDRCPPRHKSRREQRGGGHVGGRGGGRTWGGGYPSITMQRREWRMDPSEMTRDRRRRWLVCPSRSTETGATLWRQQSLKGHCNEYPIPRAGDGFDQTQQPMPWYKAITQQGTIRYCTHAPATLNFY